MLNYDDVLIARDDLTFTIDNLLWQLDNETDPALRDALVEEIDDTIDSCAELESWLVRHGTCGGPE